MNFNAFKQMVLKGSTSEILTTKEIYAILGAYEEVSTKDIDKFLVSLRTQGYSVSRGKYNLLLENPLELPVKQNKPVKPAQDNLMYLIPEVDPMFVKFGNYSTIEKIIGSRQFMPTWITGLSGNGKTYSVEQAAANTKTPIIMVNVTNETNEEDLIGSFSLETVNSYEIEVDEELYNEFLFSL